ncbi:MAG: DUF86 domain-containing protein [Bacteroidota bacterium]|nr:DUF86 domain-containing protein [Bacteroidota bacterium]
MKNDQNSLETDLQFIIESIDVIFDYLSGITQEDFRVNQQLRDACLMRLIVIGEYTARIPKEFQDSHPEIEWKDVKAARNFYVHAYIQVNWKRTWETIHNYLPSLRNNLEQMIKTLE